MDICSVLQNGASVFANDFVYRCTILNIHTIHTKSDATTVFDNGMSLLSNGLYANRKVRVRSAAMLSADSPLLVSLIDEHRD
jgi:hypothetical protein